jgi:hypothetical protein
MKEEIMGSESKNLVADEDQQLAQKVLSAIKSMKYGTVQITVHNARVTQIDKIERIRVIKDEQDKSSGN